MKKWMLIVTVILFTMIFCTGTIAMPLDEISVQVPDGAYVSAVFAGRNKQAHPTFTTNPDNLDTIWIFYTNGDFRQFVIMDGIYRLYSCGTFAFDEEGRIKPEDPSDYNNTFIFRTGKYMEGAGFGSFSSIHQYILNGSEYTKLWENQLQEKQIFAIAAGIVDDKDDDRAFYELYYSDGTYEEYRSVNKKYLMSGSGVWDAQNPWDLKGDKELLLIAGDTASGEHVVTASD